MGSVVTFYSYKGGVGRSMALANIGAILCNWGKKVLLVDWDLEAPGLEDYFKPVFPNYKQVNEKDGLIDLLHQKIINPDFKVKNINWDKYFIPININNVKFCILTSGKKDKDYVTKVKQLDFSAFYSDYDGGDYLEDIRTYWKNNFDFVLIDSRTGLTDSSGICSIHMPDILVLMFTATEQGFKGILNVANKSRKNQESLVYDRLKLKVLPIPTRFDNSELKLTEEWLDKFATDLKNVYKDFITQDKDGNDLIQPMDILKKTKVPYISFYSYGEKLPVLEQGTDDPNSIGYVYETITSILANNFQNIDKLKEERDSYIKIGKGEEVLDYAYYQQQIELEKQQKRKLEEELKHKEEAISQEKKRLENEWKLKEAQILLQQKTEKEAKKRLEDELKLKEAQILLQQQAEKEAKKRLEEELQNKIYNQQKIEKQVKQSKQIMYIVAGIFFLTLLIWFIITKTNSLRQNNYYNKESTINTDTTMTTPDTSSMMMADSTKK